MIWKVIHLPQPEVSPQVSPKSLKLREESHHGDGRAIFKNHAIRLLRVR
jgi:hypothetical protein